MKSLRPSRGRRPEKGLLDRAAQAARFVLARLGTSPERLHGQSMVLVAVVMAGLLALPAAVTALAIADVNNSSSANPQNAALTAAYAGLADYVNSLNANANFAGFNANGSGTAQNGYATPAFGGNGCASSCSAATGIWEPVYNGSSAVSNECYFYQTSSSSPYVVVSVTGRSGPTTIATTTALQPGGKATPYCTTTPGATYQYRTIAAEYANTPPQSSGYMYTDEYNVPDPIVYGLFSGGLNSCGYYAYATNPNWTFGWIGVQTSFEVYALWVGGADYDPLGIDQNFFEGPNGWNSSPGGAFGPSMGGALGSSEIFQYGAGSSPGYGDPGSNVGSGGAGAIINGNGHDQNEAYAAAFLSSVTDGYGWYNGGAGGGNASPYTDGNHNGTPNFSINGYPATIGGQNAAGGTGGPGTNNYDAAYSNSTDQPTGCGIMGAPYHDGFWTSYQNFNGNVAGANPNGGAGSAGDGLMYTSDMYYVCGTTNAGPSLGYGPNMTNVSMYSGDPYTSNTEQINNENNPGPALFNWNFNIGIAAMTLFYIGFDPVAEDYAAYPANTGPGEPYQPGAGAPNSYVASGITGNVQMYLFKGQIFGFFTFGQNPYNLGAAASICNQPDNFPNGQAGANSTISQLNTQIVPPYVSPDNASQSSPDYGLDHVVSEAQGGCIYRGNTAITFNAAGGATVQTSGNYGSLISGQTVAMGTVTTFGGSDGYVGSGPMNGCAASGSVTPGNGVFLVVDGNAYVSGTITGQYTVAVTDPCAAVTPNAQCSVIDSQVQLLPGTNGTPGSCSNNYCFSKYGGNFVAIQPSYNYQRTGASGYNGLNGPTANSVNNGTYAEAYQYADNFYDSIYIVGNLTYDNTGVAPNNCPSNGISALTTANCSNYLGLLSQNNVVVAYPMAYNGVGAQNFTYYTESGTDTDANWTFTGNSDVNVENDGDSDTAPNPCWPDSNGPCTSWNDDAHNTQQDTFPNGSNWVSADPCDGDDSNYWGICHSEGGDNDPEYYNAWNSDLHDTDADPGVGTSTGNNHNCAVNPWDDSASVSCDWGEVSTVNDGDDNANVGTTNEPFDGGTAITTIDADIDAVWGTFLLDNYGYWSNADHSCYVSYFANILGNAYDLLSDDSPNASNDTTSGPGGCASDGDGDENTIGTLTVNGAINEFFQGILTHYEAFNGNFTASGGYSQVNTNFDGRFQSHLPYPMAGIGTATWQRIKLSPVASVCPTGSIAGAGTSATEITTTCPA